MQLQNHRIELNEKLGNDSVFLIQADKFWKRGSFGNGSIVAVLDTGCDTDHEALRESIIDVRNFTSDYLYDPYNVQDGNGHGTHVAGIIAANNKNYTIGVAPQAKLVILKTLTNQGKGSVNTLIQAIYYAVNWRGLNGEKINILTMSLGSKTNNPLLHEAIRYAVVHNISIVVSTGNEGDGKKSEELSYPGAYNEVIAVGSVNNQKKISYFSNTNKEVDLVAPGEVIYSTYLNNSYKTLSGTSMAAPFVAGALALIKEENEKRLNRPLSETELYALLIKSTEHLNVDAIFEGNGFLNLGKAFL